ncbi:hypothetical protein AA313_de0209497 [Arthrobotrys entomopaga]|nr:hypothetical protein AA313_de0209497 [Arthrobotrys entomopaga]
MEPHTTAMAMEHTSEHVSEHAAEHTSMHESMHTSTQTFTHTLTHTSMQTTHKAVKPTIAHQPVANADDISDAGWDDETYSTSMPTSTHHIMSTMSTMTTMMTSTMGSDSQTSPWGSPPNPTETVRPPRYMQNFTQTFGSLDKIQAKCINERTKNSGAMFDDVMNLLSPKFTQSYTIDQHGCHQVMCLGNYSTLQLCNFKPKTESIYFSSDDIKTMVRYLRDMWRPNWKEDQVSEQLNFENKVVTGCGRNNGDFVNLGESMHYGGHSYGHNYGMHDNKKNMHNTMSATMTSAYFDPVPSAGPLRKRETEHENPTMTSPEEHKHNKHNTTYTGGHSQNKTEEYHKKKGHGAGGPEEGWHNGGGDLYDAEIEPDMLGKGFINDTLTGIILNMMDGPMGGWVLAIDSTKNGGMCDKLDNWEGEQCSGVHSSDTDCTWDYTGMGDVDGGMGDMDDEMDMM